MLNQSQLKRIVDKKEMNNSALFHRKGKPNESEDMEYHKVLVFMDPKVQRVADNLEKFDRIYLTGFINYSKENFRKHDGNEYNNGFIQPINLVKLQKFDEQ